MPMVRDSTLQDTQRIEYIQAYIDAVLNAMKYDSPSASFSPHITTI